MEEEQQETVSIVELMEILASLNEFDPVQVGGLIAYYLLISTIGFTTGVVARILKRS